MLYFMWVRHHLRPGEFWSLPWGERQFLMASTQIEIEQSRPYHGKAGGKRGR